ncbi:MAG TPA: carbonic anhydrase [Bacteriovoracaceae bacterium]|nr:carbonic anhydrase [Bacteriovoracaceae bacterium]
MEIIKKILLENKAWAKSRLDINPNYFEKMAKDQNPTFLWIGCADSRVPPAEITNTHPGDMFVHRNIANLVVHTDSNLLSVMQYAVEALKIPHIIVCGHYNCGGVRAALGHQSLGLIDNWIRNIKDVVYLNRAELSQIDNETDRVNRLVELNVIHQTRNIAHSSIIQKAWRERGEYPIIHGWVYDLNCGELKILNTIKASDVLDPEYFYEFQS